MPDGEGAESLIGFVVAAALVGVLTGVSAASFRLLLRTGLRGCAPAWPAGRTAAGWD